jgi:hypothetical protein
MSQKVNRLRNRLRIEQERDAKRRRLLDATWAKVRQESARIDVEAKNLNRSVALRMRVDRDFTRASGEMFALTITLHPREFLYQFRVAGREDHFQNASYFAEERGHEAGKKIAEVIRRCLAGELEEFAKAR